MTAINKARQDVIQWRFNMRARFDTIDFTTDLLFGTIGNVLMSFIRRLAPFAVPAAPAFFLGHAVAAGVEALDPGAAPYAVPVGMVAAVGLESAGILASHLAIKLYTEQDRRWLLAAVATVAYLVIGISAIWLLDASTADAKIVGTAMFLIAGIVYMLVALSDIVALETEAARHTAVSDQRRVDELHQLELDERRHQLRIDAERQRRLDEQAHALKLERARLRSNERVKTKQLQANTAATGTSYGNRPQLKTQPTQVARNETATKNATTAATDSETMTPAEAKALAAWDNWSATDKRTYTALGNELGMTRSGATKLIKAALAKNGRSK